MVRLVHWVRLVAAAAIVLGWGCTQEPPDRASPAVRIAAAMLLNDTKLAAALHARFDTVGPEHRSLHVAAKPDDLPQALAVLSSLHVRMKLETAFSFTGLAFVDAKGTERAQAFIPVAVQHRTLIPAASTRALFPLLAEVWPSFDGARKSFTVSVAGQDHADLVLTAHGREATPDVLELARVHGDMYRAREEYGFKRLVLRDAAGRELVHELTGAVR